MRSYLPEALKTGLGRSPWNNKIKYQQDNREEHYETSLLVVASKSTNSVIIYYTSVNYILNLVIVIKMLCQLSE